MLSRDDLHDYQRRAVDFIKDEGRCGLFLDMGLGKTTSTLTAITDLLDSFEVHKVLVVAPLRVANSVWKQEVDKWEHLGDLRVSVCTGSKRERLAALKTTADIYVINRENIPWLVEHYGKQWPFDMVVIDESSSFKNATSKRFKALRKVLPMTDRMVLLTGTPSPNGLMDLWAQIYLLDMGGRLGRTLTAYRQRFFDQGYMGWTYELREGSAEKIHALIADKVVHMSAEDYLDMPERIDVTREVDLPPATLAEYKVFENTMFLELEEDEIEALTAGVLANKLMQYASGAVYTNDKGAWKEVHKEKLDALAEIIEDNPGENILVAYNFKSDLERLLKKFPKARVLDKDQKTIDAWNNGDIPLLFAHPACLHPSTKVLTEHRGWVNITDVSGVERVFDGVEFVSHSGCQFSGVKPVTEVFGIKMTYDHKILVAGQWVRAENVSTVKDARRKALYTYEGDDDCVRRMFDLREGYYNPAAELRPRQSSGAKALFGLYRNNFPSHDEHETVENMEGYGGALHETKRPRLSSLRGTRDNNIKTVARVRNFLARHATRLLGPSNIGSDQQRQRVFKGELSLGNEQGPTIEQTQQPDHTVERGEHSLGGVLSSRECVTGCDNTAIGRGDECRESLGGLSRVNVSERAEVSDVYDLVDCGPRNRFVVMNDEGEVFISHNSAGHGLNLQRGGALCVWFSLNWSLELYQQFNARLYRQGQDRPVRIVHLVCGGTIDRRAIKVLTDKGAVQADLLTALKPTDN